MNQEDRKSRYAHLCKEKNITSLFMQPWWLDAAGEWDVSFAFRNDQFVGAMPYAIRRRLGLTYFSMPTLTHHMSLWTEKPANISEHKWLTREKQIIWSIIDNFPRHAFFSMVFADNSFDNWLPFYWKGFRQEMRYTFIIENKIPGEDFLPDINRNVKRNVKEADAAFNIQSSVSQKEFHEVCMATYVRQKMKAPYSFADFKKIDDAVYQHNAGIRLAAVDHANKVVAVSYLLWDDHTAYYFMAGDTHAGRQHGASMLLCHEAIRIAFQDKKLKTFDFCGSMIEPITEIRRQFGARSVPLMKIFKANYKWLDILYQLTH